MRNIFKTLWNILNYPIALSEGTNYYIDQMFIWGAILYLFTHLTR